MFKARVFIGLLAIPLLALVIACSGGDDDDDAPAPATGGGSTAGQSTGSDGSTGAQSTGAGGGATGGQSTGSATGATGATGPTGGGAGDSSDDFDAEDCPELQAFVDSAGVGDALAGDGVLGVDFDAEDFQQLAENAPGEIRDDMQLLADALEEFFGKMEDLEVDFSNPASFASLTPAELAELEEASASFDNPEILAASDRVTAFFEEICS